MRFGTLNLVFLLVSSMLSDGALACSSGTRAQREVWALERQKTLSRSQKVVGTFRELSRTESVSYGSTKTSLQDGNTAGDEIPYTTVRGEFLNKKGTSLYFVQFTEWHDVGVCRWGYKPLNGDFGTFYLEKPKNGVREIVHFAIRRKK